MRSPFPGLLLLPLCAVVAFGAAGCGSSPQPPAETASAAGPDTVASTAYPVNFQVAVADPSPGWGRPIEVQGRVTGVGDQRRALLQFRRHGGRYRTIDRAPVAPDGSYAFSAPLPAAGTIRVTLAPQPGADVAPADEPSSAPQPVRVRATLSFATRKLTPDNDAQAVIAGRVKPARPDRSVVAQAYTNSGWKPVARTATDGEGRYRLAWKPKDSRWVRVVAAGDRRAGAATRLAGQSGDGQGGLAAPGGLRMTATGPMRQALASRYDDYDLPLACGGTLGRSEQGVAHKTLPCGTLVTITYNGRTVQVPVIDRGPYIEPREFDLTGATANTLGFEGVHMISVSP